MRQAQLIQKHGGLIPRSRVKRHVKDQVACECEHIRTEHKNRPTTACRVEGCPCEKWCVDRRPGGPR